MKIKKHKYHFGIMYNYGGSVFNPIKHNPHGPAYISITTKAYYHHDKWHNIVGPAREIVNRHCSDFPNQNPFYINGVQI